MINRWKLAAASAPGKCHSSCCSLCLIRPSPFVSYELPSIPMAPPKHSLLRGAILDPLHTHTHTHTHPGSPLFWALWYHPRRLLQQLGHTPGRIADTLGFTTYHHHLACRDCGWKESSLSLSHSLSLSLSLSFYFFYNFKQNRLKKNPRRCGKRLQFPGKLENFSLTTSRAKDSKDSKQVNLRLKSPLMKCVTD